MEFEEFARQFRQRTTQRMMEFEKALAAAQERVEKSVAAPQPGNPPRPRAHSHSQPPPPPQPPSRRQRAGGQVQGLLRRTT